MYRRAVVETANLYLTEAHRVKLDACSHNILGFETFWVWYHYRIRGLAFLVLHILMAFVAGLELYPGGLSKPWPVIIATVALVAWKVVGSQIIYYKAQDPIWYCAWARISLFVLGIGTAILKLGELLLIAYLVPNSRVVTARDVFNVAGPILVEILSTALLSLGSHKSSAIFLGHKGEIFEELNSRSVAGALTNQEKSKLLKVLFVGLWNASFPTFLRKLTLL